MVFFAPQPLCLTQDVRHVQGQSAARLQLIHPVAHRDVGPADEGQEFRCGRAFEAQPVVEGLFHAPRGLAEILEADHAPAALEGMEAAPDGGEVFLIAGGGDQQVEMAGDGVTNGAGFLDEDVQQFGVDLCVAGIQQTRRLGRQCGRHCFGHDGRWRSEGGAGIEQVEGLAGLLFEFGVGGEAGILAQAFEVEEQLGAQADVVRVFLEGGGEGGGFALLLDEFGFEAVAGAVTGTWVEDLFEIRRSVLEGVDEHAEGREAVGDVFEDGRFWRLATALERGDGGRTVLHEAYSGALVHDRQCAFDLFEGRRGGGQQVGAGGLPEESVEMLLYVAQVGEDFMGKLATQLLIGRVGVGDGQRGWLFAPQIGLDALGDCGNLLLEARTRGRHFVTVHQALNKQHGRRHVHGQGVGEAQGILAQPLRQAAEPFDERGGMGLANRAGGGGEGREGVLETGQADGAAAGEQGPGFTRITEPAVQRHQQGRHRCVAHAPAGGRDQVDEPIGFAQGVDGGRVAAGDGDLIEHVPHQPFCDDGRAFEEASHLGIDAPAEALEGRIDVDGLLAEGIEEGGAGKPECARGGLALSTFDPVDGIAHLGRTAGVARIAQPFEQATLKSAAQGAQGARIVRATLGERCEGRTQGEVGVEQVRRARCLMPAGFDELRVEFKETQRLVGLAAGQFVEVIAQGGESPGGEAGDGRRVGDLFGGQLAQQTIEGFRKLGEAIQTDDGQGTVGLVQVGLGELDAAKAVGGRLGFGEGAGGAFQGQVDFAFDPGQRAKVEFVCGAHRCIPVGVRSR